MQGTGSGDGGPNSALQKVFDQGKELFGQATNLVKLPCDDAIGYLAVYRICFVVALFFGLMAILMIGVRSSRDPRGHIQNGFWGIKFILIFGGWIGAFFIPHGSFGPVMMWIGMLGGMAFILVQLVLIVDFAHTWAETWQENYRSSSDQNWFWALLSSTVFFYILCIVSVGLCFGYYTGVHTGDCRLHEFLISFNMILCLIISVTSVLPIIQEHQPNSGLLQASFVSLYILYLTWSAMSNQPDKNCKPDLSGFFGGGNKTFMVHNFSSQKTLTSKEYLKKLTFIYCVKSILQILSYNDFHIYIYIFFFRSVTVKMSKLYIFLIQDQVWTQLQSSDSLFGLSAFCILQLDQAPMLRLLD